MKNLMAYFKLSPLYEILFPIMQKKQLIKQQTVKQYALQYSIKTFVETGTYLGSMIDAVKDVFDKIYTIELDEILYKRVKKKFAGLKHISLTFGDSAKVLPVILKKIKEPALFWLDAHYSGGITAKGKLNTPVSIEIQSILRHKVKNHIILIDDANLFVGKNNYPTIKELKDTIFKKYSQANVKIENNIIRIILSL